MEITLFRRGDGEPMAAVLNAVIAVSPFHANGPEDFLCDPAAFFYAAHINGDVAGLAWGVQIRYPTGRLMTYLHHLDVVDTFRRRGVATALVRAAMELAKERGSSRFWLSTGGHNEIAQSLYESLSGVRKPLGDVNYWWDL